MTAVLKINEELNGIELYFSNKPTQSVLETLKGNKFRWSGFKKCWYAKQSEKTLQVANSLTGDIQQVAEPEQVKTLKLTKNTLSLWEATQWTELELTQKQKDQDNKLIAKELKAHVKNRFPQVKFSVTSKGWNSVNFYIVSSPYEKESEYLKAIYNYCKKLVDAYKHCYDPGDPYTDYAGSYNFYGYAEIDWDYKQTETTEEIKKDMADFDSKLNEWEKAEEERKWAAHQEWMKQRELETIEFNKRQEEEKKQVENIYNSIDVKELDEINQYFVIGSEFANLNKNNTLDEYKEEVKKGDYTLEDVKITKEIHFNNVEALTNFSNMLLNDFDFLADTGGSYTDDIRFNSMTDFYNMDKEERNTVKWNLKGVAVYFNNKLQFVIDAQGYSYARYVGLTDNATVKKSLKVVQLVNKEELAELQLEAETLADLSTQVIEELDIIETWNKENWNEYKEGIKQKLNDYSFKLTKKIIQQLEGDNLKSAMYKLLTEVDGIQEQFKKADIQQGEKVTLFYISDWGTITTSRITFDSVTNTKYAQYDNAVKLTFKPEKKRNLHYNHFYKELLVYNGWLDLPETVLHNVEERNGFMVTSSKYHSCDHEQYDEIINHFSEQGIKPIINTYKPIF